MVGVGASGTVDDAVRFVETANVHGFPMYWDDTFEAWSAFNVSGTPSALLVSPDGEPLAGWVGPVAMDEILEYL